MEVSPRRTPIHIREFNFFQIYITSVSIFLRLQNSPSSSLSFPFFKCTSIFFLFISNGEKPNHVLSGCATKSTNPRTEICIASKQHTNVPHLWFFFFFLSGAWMRSTRTAVSPTLPPPPVTMTPTWSTSALVIRTTSTLRTGNLLLRPVGGDVREVEDSDFVDLNTSVYMSMLYNVPTLFCLLTDIGHVCWRSNRGSLNIMNNQN